ncbi:hypothetical protein AX14_004680 [Amanita brunnescens Koide BX004]|nr:hypothetical protein AX14_004680 [Amanita brunnescens Koide BX004]
MLIAYALLIFALTSSVVARPSPPQQASVSEPGKLWKTLQGALDLRLVEAKDSEKRFYRWYRLKKIVMRFVPFDGRIKSVYYDRLRRDNDHNLLRSGTKYSPQKSNVPVDSKDIPLVGVWGRASKLEDLPEGAVGPVVDYDIVMEIKKFGEERKYRFLEDEAHFSPALTVYSEPVPVPDPWQTLEGNTDLALLLEGGPDPFRYWYRLKNITYGHDYPIWPRDESLDHVMVFIPVDGHVNGVSYLKLHRIEENGQMVLVPKIVDYPEGEEFLHVDDWRVPLEGYWGRGCIFNNLHGDSKGLQVLTHFEPVIEIKNSGVSIWRRGWKQRQIRFLKDDEMKSYAFNSALTHYDVKPKRGREAQGETVTKYRDLQPRPKGPSADSPK